MYERILFPLIKKKKGKDALHLLSSARFMWIYGFGSLVPFFALITRQFPDPTNDFYSAFILDDF